MRGGLLKSWSGLALLVLLGACSNIIGISSYEVDPTLDDSGGTDGTGAKTSKGGVANGGSKTIGEGGAPIVGGEETGGTEIGGTKASGGKGSGGTNAGGRAGTPTAGEGGAGGEPVVTPTGCTSAKDCDDTIDCTTDACDGGGKCTHAPKDSLCDSTMCETCTIGIGCVAGPKQVTQLLLDASFDETTGDWDDSGSDVANVMTVVGAQSGTQAAKFGPAGLNAKEQVYSDLLQTISVPKGTVALTLTGYYKFTPGNKMPTDDYVALAIYDFGGTMPLTQFHSYPGNATAKSAWTAFTFSAPKAEVAPLGGNDYTFDLVGYQWGGVYYFDTLQLNATVCQ